jgi:hypothetical protein
MKISSAWLRLAGMALVIHLPAAHSQTHCGRGEDTEFSCKIKGSAKLASLCSGDLDSGQPDERWLQYRFGVPGKIELRYPEQKAGSLQRFEGVYYSKYDYLSYNFASGEALYEIQLSEEVGMAPKNKDGLWFSGLLRVDVGKTHVELQCEKPVPRDYWEGMIRLSPATHQWTGDGKDSLVYRYHHRHDR